MNFRRLSMACAVLLVAVGCASATQPAIRVGGAELSRSELIDAVEGFGAQPGPTIDRAGGFNQAMINVVNDLFIRAVDSELEARGVAPELTDEAAVAAQFQLPADFDPAVLSEQEREAYEREVRVAALARALAGEGSSIDEFITDISDNIEIDPRYGAWDPSRGYVPPALPELES